ncbi:hypothetical protein OP10G_2095 [Fimbriimonas ginsengisoli Gsoil 348]|uniref:Uncharacterized protein n=1 Tax=Fimbriimonas ginsengisoli Gsoil 348 TaxID=661478 RepID=A0A068NPI0_FIMGI|nr:hypothetical protein OP10G_2095 [Fimbriimonas ginsengisoli Gsoil 348]
MPKPPSAPLQSWIPSTSRSPSRGYRKQATRSNCPEAWDTLRTSIPPLRRRRVAGTYACRPLYRRQPPNDRRPSHRSPSRSPERATS